MTSQNKMRRQIELAKIMSSKLWALFRSILSSAFSEERPLENGALKIVHKMKCSKTGENIRASEAIQPKGRTSFKNILCHI